MLLVRIFGGYRETDAICGSSSVGCWSEAGDAGGVDVTANEEVDGHRGIFGELRSDDDDKISSSWRHRPLEDLTLAHAILDLSSPERIGQNGGGNKVLHRRQGQQLDAADHDAPIEKGCNSLPPVGITGSSFAPVRRGIL
jgi:hypothetical protein